MYERYLYSVDPLDGAAGVGGNLQMLGTPGYGQVFNQVTGGASVIPGMNGSLLGNAEFYNREEGAIWYDSPNWNGFTFGAYTTLSQFKNNGTPTTPGVNPTIWGGGAKYVGYRRTDPGVGRL